ncbi:hypothetical protein AGMMS49579_14370 [Spirochaetia bacterium]|nr:hypothetical protein AGMMS49579_14330 [Spirochaetia bacterium]GHV54218.1 hypothetical protein AGMMS49579_14370 [Spirochaetia bacterium]
MPEVTFSTKALQQYMEWQTEDQKTLKRINDLIKDILRNGFMKGIGKPEPENSSLARAIIKNSYNMDSRSLS